MSSAESEPKVRRRRTLRTSELVMTPREVAQALGVSRETAYALVRRLGVRLGPNKIVLPKRRFEELLEHGDTRPLRPVAER